MRADSRFESVDRDMSSWVLTCVHNGTRFYVAEYGGYTDMLRCARRYRYHDLAADASASMSEPGFTMEPISVAEVNS